MNGKFIVSYDDFEDSGVPHPKLYFSSAQEAKEYIDELEAEHRID